MSKETSSFLATIAIVVTAGFASPAAANEYPRCTQYTGGTMGGGRNCGFVSYALCMQTIRSMGGFCKRSLFYADVRSDQPAAAQASVQCVNTIMQDF